MTTETDSVNKDQFPLSTPAVTKGGVGWKKIRKAADRSLKWACSVAKVIRSAGGVFKELPIILSNILVGFKFPSILRLPWDLQKTAQDITKIFKSSSFYEKIRSGLKTVSDINGLVASAASSISILKVARLISTSIGRWIPLWGMLSFPISLISVGFSIESMTKLHGLKECLDRQLRTVGNKDSSEQKKVEALLDGLKRFQEEGIDGLRKGSLRISKSACQTKGGGKSGLELRVDDLMQRLRASSNVTKEQREKDISDAARFMQDLAKRVGRAQTLDLLELVASVAAVTGAFFMMFTPLSIPGAVLVLGSAVVSLGLMAGKAMFLKRDPFRDYVGDEKVIEANRWRQTSRWEKICKRICPRSYATAAAA